MTNIGEEVTPKLNKTNEMECYDFLPFQRRLIETCLVTILGGVLILPRIIRTLSLPKDWEIISSSRLRASREIFGIRKVLLVVLCLVYGMELHEKITNEPLVSLLQTSHVITVMQIYLLSSHASRTCMAVFRVHMHLLHAPFLTMVLLFKTKMADSAVDHLVTRAHHVLIALVVPSYLVLIGGPYRCDVLKNLSWPLLTTLLYGFYQFYFIQPVAMVTLVNLNGILCPASPDQPFHGPWYRTWAVLYEFILVLVLGKFLCVTMYAVGRVWDMRKGERKGEGQGKDTSYIDAFMEVKRE